MKKLIFAVLILTMVVSLAACGGAAPAPTATTAPEPVAPTKAPAAPTAAAPTAVPPTATAATKPVALKLWHGWTDANELALLPRRSRAFEKANPGSKVEPAGRSLRPAQDQVHHRSQHRRRPDLLIGPKDWIGELTNAKLIAPLDDVAKDILADLNPAAVDGQQVRRQGHGPARERGGRGPLVQQGPGEDPADQHRGPADHGRRHRAWP